MIPSKKIDIFAAMTVKKLKGCMKVKERHHLLEIITIRLGNMDVSQF